MYKLTQGEFIRAVNKAKTEEDVKYAYAHNFNIKFDTSEHLDLYTPQILFEFKKEKKFSSKKILAEILSQSLYYIHKLKYGLTDKIIPRIICLADKHQVVFTETYLWKEFYTDSAKKYDWDLPPSSPDTSLVRDIYSTEELRNIHIYQLELEHEFKLFHEKLVYHLNPQRRIEFGDKKLITEENFEDVYKYWEHEFGESVYNGLKPSKYFVSDIQPNNTIVRESEGVILFRTETNEYKKKKILPEDYNHFWSLYEKVKNPATLRGIIAKIDRLNDEFSRRFHGEFFTPLNFANKGLEYVEKTLGINWWKDKYRIWDMAAGTGNLQYYLPNDAYQFCYLSTLYHEDVEHLNKLFPSATSFQYDYLNDDIDLVFKSGKLQFLTTWKLPEKLREDLANPHLKWLIQINPPFATSQTSGTSGRSKKDVSNTILRKVMHANGLGEVSRELFCQFLFRIKKEMEGCESHLALYSTLKYINANNDQKFRDKVFQFEFEKGFMFSSANFSGTKKNNAFPVCFAVWDLNKKKHLESQDIEVDVFESNMVKMAKKRIVNENRTRFLSKWVDRPRATINFPPLKSALIVDAGNKDVRNRISIDFIGSLMCKGNDFQNQNFTALLSAPYVSAGAFSITPQNFEKSMVIHAVRRIPKANWINDRDQFKQPVEELSEEFIIDCTIWNLFSNSNQTVAMKDVKYKTGIYQIKNHFFPFLISKVSKWKIADSEISLAMVVDENRFVANWLSSKKISSLSKNVLDVAEKIYENYFNNLHRLRTPKFKIQTWDAGWYQIRNALSDMNLQEEMLQHLKDCHNALGKSLLPRIEKYEFIDFKKKEIILSEDEI